MQIYDFILKYARKVQEKCKKKVLLKSANKNPQMQKSLCKNPFAKIPPHPTYELTLVR